MYNRNVHIWTFPLYIVLYVTVIIRLYKNDLIKIHRFLSVFTFAYKFQTSIRYSMSAFLQALNELHRAIVSCCYSVTLTVRCDSVTWMKAANSSNQSSSSIVLETSCFPSKFASTPSSTVYSCGSMTTVLFIHTWFIVLLNAKY